MDCVPKELVPPPQSMQDFMHDASPGQPGMQQGAWGNEYPPGNQTKTEPGTRSAPQSADSVTPPSVSKVPLPKCRDIMTRACSDAKLGARNGITTPLRPCRTFNSISLTLGSCKGRDVT